MDNIIFLYEKAMYYVSVTYGEYNKIGQFFRDTALIITLLAVRGYKPKKWQIATFFFGIIIISIVSGIILVNLKIPQYSNSLGNQQNPQMVQILQQQQEILNKLNEQR